MLVLRLEVRHFRGFAHAVVLPRGHALVVGEPRAGRSDLLAALKRVLDPDATKATLEEWDFHGRDLARDIEIEVVLGELAPDLRQRFLGELEFWDPDRKLVLPGSDTALSEQWNGNWRLDAEWVNWPAEDVQLALAG